MSSAQRSAEPLPPVCILAGGLGSRLGQAVSDTPKPLLDVAGEPFVFHQLRLLAAYGVNRVVLCVGYLGEQLAERVGAERFGIAIDYSYDGDALIGTLGAIRRAAPLLGPRFLVLYGDTYLRIDYAQAADMWERSQRAAMMTVLRNRGRWDRSNATFDGSLVTAYDKRAPAPEMSWIDYGLGGLEREALGAVEDSVTDLCDLYHELAVRRELFGFEADLRFYEIGTPAALAETSAFLAARGGG